MFARDIVWENIIKTNKVKILDNEKVLSNLNTEGKSESKIKG